MASTTTLTKHASDKRPKVTFMNVGCKLNQHELEALKNGFVRNGYNIATSDEKADICVVNTCTVNGSGDADSRKAVRRAIRKNPAATVVATGCYAQRSPQDMTDSGASLVIGNDRKSDLIELVENHLSGTKEQKQVGEFSSLNSRKQPFGQFLEIVGSVPDGRTRATLKIQDGCDEHCTYCIIPKVRGQGISRSADEVIRQAEMMVQSGYQEIALTGVHSGSYGYDNGQTQALVALLQRLDNIEGLARIRLNSIEPGYVSEELIEHAASSEKFCRHFHIPLQSGDNEILKRMGRRYQNADYAAIIDRIYTSIPNCCLGTDVMVGFPGEKRPHFDNTYQLLSDLPMTYLHVFPYSLRTGTPAEHLPEHLDHREKRERTDQLIQLSKEKRIAFHRQFVGHRVCPLVEDRFDRCSGLPIGLTDNYLKVIIDTNAPNDADANPGDIVDVKITQAREETVFGSLS